MVAGCLMAARGRTGGHLPSQPPSHHLSTSSSSSSPFSLFSHKKFRDGWMDGISKWREGGQWALTIGKPMKFWFWIKIFDRPLKIDPSQIYWKMLLAPQIYYTWPCWQLKSLNKSKWTITFRQGLEEDDIICLFWLFSSFWWLSGNCLSEFIGGPMWQKMDVSLSINQHQSASISMNPWQCVNHVVNQKETMYLA